MLAGTAGRGKRVRQVIRGNTCRGYLRLNPTTALPHLKAEAVILLLRPVGRATALQTVVDIGEHYLIVARNEGIQDGLLGPIRTRTVHRQAYRIPQFAVTQDDQQLAGPYALNVARTARIDDFFHSHRSPVRQVDQLPYTDAVVAGCGAIGIIFARSQKQAK